MKAVITDGCGRLWVDDVPEPNLGPYDCLVRMECCAFCNSTDRHIVEGAAVMGLQYPAVLGHESVGIIEHVGDLVNNFHVGDRVLRAYAMNPDEMHGTFASGWGGFAEYGKITDWKAMGNPAGALLYQQKVPVEIDAQLATLLIPQKEVYSATGSIEPIKGQRFMVAGAGIVGLLFGLFLKKRGAAQVAMVARRREALDQVMAMNAADEIHCFDQLPGRGDAFDSLIETTGSLDAIAALLPCVRKGGPLYAYAVYPKGMKDPSLLSLCQNHSLIRLRPNEAGCHQEVCDMVLRGELNHRVFIKHELPMTQVQKAWQTVLERRTLKTLVRMS